MANLFGDREQSLRANGPQLRVAPSDQGFGTDDRPIRACKLRLEQDFDLVSLNGAKEVERKR
jgi:hypothetical protein